LRGKSVFIGAGSLYPFESFKGFSRKKLGRVKNLSMEEKPEYDSRVLGSGEFVQALLREADVGMARQIRPKIREFLVKKEMKDFYTQAGVRWGNFAGGVKGEWWPM
jgi:hypothetical protein